MPSIRQTWRTFRGLITLADLTGVVGFWLYRGTARRTLSVAIALMALVVLDRKNDQLGISLGSAITGTTLVLIVSCVGGLAMMIISGSFSKSVLQSAEAKGSNLLEDMKKARAPLHRHRLWDRVFRYEQAYSSEEDHKRELDAVRRLIGLVWSPPPDAMGLLEALRGPIPAPQEPAAGHDSLTPPSQAQASNGDILHPLGHEDALAVDDGDPAAYRAAARAEALDAPQAPPMDEHVAAARRHELEAELGTLGQTQAGWELLFDYLTRAPVPVTTLVHGFRFDLSPILFWYDGAPFHPSDSKLLDQYHGSDTLRHAHKLAGFGLGYDIELSVRRWMQMLWFRLITRAVQLRVAKACQKLDLRYRSFRFTPDLFLWPTEETYALLARMVGPEACEEVALWRRRIFHHVLHPEANYATKLMRLAIYPNFRAATHLRRHVDPDYVVGRLRESWAADVHQYDRALGDDRVDVFIPSLDTNLHSRDPAEIFTRRACLRQEALDAYLAKEPPGGAAPSPLELRAYRMAVHVNHQGLADRLTEPAPASLAAQAKAKTKTAANRKAKYPHPRDILASLAPQAANYTRILLAVRTHHELTRFELEDYEHYLHRILK